MSTNQPRTVAGSGPGATNVVAVARGASFLAGGQLFSSAIRLVMAVLMARWLGADDYGLYILAIGVGFAASGLASLGLDAAMERYVAVNTGRNDGRGLAGSLQVGIVGTLVTSTLLGAAVLIFAGPIATGLFDEPRLERLLTVSAILTPLLATSTLLVAVLMGFKRMDQSSLADNVVQPVARFVLLLAMAALGISAVRAGVAFAISYAISIALMIRFVAKAHPWGRSSVRPRRDIREIGAFSFPFWFSGLLRIVRVRLQPLLLGVFGSTASVGVFTVVTSANMLGRVANLAINKALRPTIAQLHDKGDRNEVQRLYATTTRWTLSANLPVFLIMVLAPESLLAVFGPNFTTGVTALVIVACGGMVNAATGICGAVIAMSTHNRMKLVNSFIWVGVSLAANVILIPLYGIVGAAVAILVSSVTVNLVRVVELWVLMRILPWNRQIWKPVLAAVATAGVVSLILLFLPEELGLVLLAALSVTTVVVFFGVLGLLGLEADDRLIIDGARRTALRRMGRSVTAADTQQRHGDDDQRET